MTPETEIASHVLAYTTALSPYLSDWRHLAPAVGVLGAVALAVRLIPTAPTGSSVRPSASPAPTLLRRGGVSAPGTDGRAERVGGGRSKEPEAKRWAVDGLVPYGPVPRRRVRVGVPPWRWERRGYVTTILGAGGTGKSYVLLDLALAALAGGDWLGRGVGAVRAVLYVDTELDAEECRGRAFLLARGRGLLRPPGGFHYLHLQASLAAEEGQALVQREAARLGAGLILVDSLTIGAFDVAASDQNGWNRVLSFLETLGVPVVAIDHLDKAGKGAFGSFMKQAKVRSALQLTRLSGGSLRVEHTKSNFGPLSPAFLVRAEFGDTEVRFSPLYAEGAKPADGPGSPVAQRDEARGRRSHGYAGSSPAGGSGAAPVSPLPPPSYCKEPGETEIRPTAVSAPDTMALQEMQTPPLRGALRPAAEASRGGAPILPLPLPVLEPPSAPKAKAKEGPQVLQERATEALAPALASGGWVPPARLVKALMDERVCSRTKGYQLLASLAEAGLLERDGDPALPARAYRLPAPASEAPASAQSS